MRIPQVMVCICTCADADFLQCFVSRERLDVRALKFGVWLDINKLCVLHYTGMDASARAHLRVPLPYLGNGWTDCAEILYVVRDQFARQLTQISGGVHLHVRT